VTPANTDLNKGNKCSCSGQGSEYLFWDRNSLKDEEKREMLVEYFMREYGFEEDKLRKVLKRLVRKDVCGTEGLVGYVRELGSGDVRLEYIPFSCGCESCEYCSVRKRKIVFNRVTEKLEWYLENGEELDFFTITYGRVEADKLLEAYSDFAKKLRKLYSWKLGKKNLRRWKEKAYEELRLYLENVEDPEERERKRLQHEYFIETSFQNVMKAIENGAEKLFSVFPYMFLKIEITYREGSFHIHAHGITVRTLSRFVWLALLKLLGFGEIFDIRRVRNVKKVVNYLRKYLLKSDEVKFDNLRDEIIYEYTLYGRRKVREWGGESYVKEEEEEEYEKEIVYVLKLELKMELRDHISRLEKSVPGLKYIGGEFEFRGEKYYMYVDEYGKYVLDKRFLKEIEEEIMMDMYPVLYKFTRKLRKKDCEIVEEKVVENVELEEEKSFLNINFV